MHDPPYRAVARRHATLAQLHDQRPQRHVRGRRQPGQQPLPLRRQRVIPRQPIALAATLPVARYRCDHFTTLATLTLNRAATARQLSPSNTAVTTVREGPVNRLGSSMMAPSCAASPIARLRACISSCPRTGGRGRPTPRLEAHATAALAGCLRHLRLWLHQLRVGYAPRVARSSRVVRNVK